MGWVCKRCETYNDYAASICEVCDHEETKAKAFVRRGGAPDAKSPIVLPEEKPTETRSGRLSGILVLAALVLASAAKDWIYPSISETQPSEVGHHAATATSQATRASPAPRASTTRLPPAAVTKPSAIPNQNRGAKERLARAAEEARTAKSLIEEVDDQSLRLAKLNRQGLLTIQAADTEKRKLVAKSQQALRHSERALGLNRSSEVAWVQKASALFLLKGTPWLSSPERAMNVVDEALRRFPDNVDLRDLKAKLQKTVGRGRV